MNAGYTLDPDEKVIRIVKRHWIDLMPVVVSPAVLIIVAMAFVYFYSRFSNAFGMIPVGLVVLIILILCLLATAILLVGLFVYRQNRLVLTDKHLIQITQSGLFSRSVAQLSLTRVQDVTAVRTGVFPTLLNYGTIEVETAGEEENMRFFPAANPQQLADQCLALHDKRPLEVSMDGVNPDL